MKMILILDDRQEEIDAAVEALSNVNSPISLRPFPLDVRRHGINHLYETFEVHSENIGGIVTDLFFNPHPAILDTYPFKQIYKQYEENPPPSGLLAVMYALGKHIPVVVCTYTGELDGGHHSREASWIYDAFVAPVSEAGEDELPFGWIESIMRPKDWVRAAKDLVKRISIEE